MAAKIMEDNTRKRITRLAYVRVAEMLKLPTGNRDVRESPLKKLMKIWDDDHIGVFTLSLRDDGAYYILDGQHRHEALLIMGRGREQFPAEVHEGLTETEELLLCEAFNNNRRQWNAVDKFKNNLALSDPDTCHVQEAVMKAGLFINLVDGKKTNGRIPSVGTLMKLRTNYADGMLEQVLSALTSAFGTEEGFTGEVLLGTAAFITAFRDHQNFEFSEMVKALRGSTPKRIEVEGKQARDLLGLRSEEGVAYQILRAYNHKKRSRRLPEWHEVDRRGRKR